MATVDELGGAIDANNLDEVKELLAASSGLADSPEGTPPPLHWAIYRDRPEIVGLLLDHGADIERKDQDRGATPTRSSTRARR